MSDATQDRVSAAIAAVVTIVEDAEKEKAAITKRVSEAYSQARSKGLSGKVLRRLVKVRSKGAPEGFKNATFLEQYNHAHGLVMAGDLAPEEPEPTQADIEDAPPPEAESAEEPAPVTTEPAEAKPPQEDVSEQVDNAAAVLEQQKAETADDHAADAIPAFLDRRPPPNDLMDAEYIDPDTGVVYGSKAEMLAERENGPVDVS